MAKVITHEEVNALISSVFPSDPKMAVLYGDLSTDERFVINPNNAVTNLPYKANQALLDADIRVRGSLTVTLEPESATVLSTATTMVFNITTGGTGTITTWTVSSATIGGADRKSNTSFNSSHTKVTMTIPANTSYSSKVGAVQISVTTGDGTFPSNTAQSTQNPASRLAFQNATSSQSSTATTTTQAFTNNNCTNVAVQSKSTGVNATISGSNVVITFPQNTGNTSVTRTVTISGKTADNVTTSTTHTITQQAAVGTGMVFEYNGNDLGSGSGSIPASDFTLTLTNARLTSSAQTGGLMIMTGGTATAPTISVSSYPANPSDSEKEYTITLNATDIYGSVLAKSVTIKQEADTYTFTITPNPNTVGAFDTTAVFTVTTSNINNVGISAYDSGITGRTYSNNTLTTNFSTNSGTSGRSMEISLTGTTAAGRTITRSAEISQPGGGAANLSIVYNGGATRVSQVGLDTNDFTITANNVTVTGYSATNGAGIVSSGATSVTVRIPENQTDLEKEYKVIVSGTNQYDQTTVRAETTVYQSSDEYTLKLVPSATSVEFTSTGYTLDIVSSNVTGIVISSHDGTTSETISGNQLVLGYDINDSATSRNITVSLSGTTATERPVSCSAVITQAGASGLDLSISYTGQGIQASAGTTNDFIVTKGGNVTILGYSVDVQGASISTGATVTDITLAYPNNQTESPVTYTITVTGSTPTGYVSDSCTVNQAADTYAFNLDCPTRTIQPDFTAAFFNLTATSINNIGYYAPDSLNVTGIINLTDNSVSATGITPNMTGQQKTIRLVLSGNTVGGRTVYATGVTAQDYTKSDFDFENDFTESWDTESVIISFNYDYLMQDSGEVSLTSEGGAYFDSLLTSTGTTVAITRNVSGQTGYAVVYFAKNQSSSQRVYTINATGNVGQAGETTSLNDRMTITHDVPGQANLSLTQIGSESASFSGSTLQLSGTSSNVNVNSIGIDSGSSSSATYGTITRTGNDYAFSADIQFNTGDSRDIDVIVSASTLSGGIITATATLHQNAFPSSEEDEYFISVTPDGTVISPTATTVTYGVEWNYLKENGTIDFLKDTAISTQIPSISITSSNWMHGTTSITVTISENTDPGAYAEIRLTGTTLDAAGARRSDVGYYEQSPAVEEFENLRFTIATASASTLNLSATGSASDIRTYEDRFINGSYVENIERTSDSTYELYTGNTKVSEFTCVLAGQKYADSCLTISYTVSGRISISSNNQTTGQRPYRLVASHLGNEATLDISVAPGTLPTDANVSFNDLWLREFSNNTNTNITGISISSFTISDADCGSTISSSGLTLNDLGPMEDHENIEMQWISNPPTVQSHCGSTLAAELVFYAESDSGWIDSTSHIRINGTNYIGSLDEEESYGNKWIYRYNIPILSAGTINFGDVEIFVSIIIGSAQVSVGNLAYRIEKYGDDPISSVTFDSFTVGTYNGRSVSGASRTFTNVSATTSTTSSWDSNTFSGLIGDAIVGRLTATTADDCENYALPVVQITNHGSVQGTIVSHIGNTYVFEFILGTIPDAGKVFNDMTVSLSLFYGFDLKYAGDSSLIPWGATDAQFLLYCPSADKTSIGMVSSGSTNVDSIVIENPLPLGQVSITAVITKNCGDSTRPIRLEVSAFTSDHSNVLSDSDLHGQDCIHANKFIISGSTKGVVVRNETNQTIVFDSLEIYCGNDAVTKNPLSVHTSGGGISLLPNESTFVQSSSVDSGMTNAVWAYAVDGLRNLPTYHNVQLDIGNSFTLTDLGPEHKEAVENDVVVSGSEGTITLTVSNF